MGSDLTDDVKGKPVTDKTCEERTNNIKTTMESLESKINIVIGHHKERMDDNKENIKELAGLVRENGEHVRSILQWKKDKDEKKDLSFRMMTIITGIAVMMVGIFSNITRIITFMARIMSTKP